MNTFFYTFLFIFWALFGSFASVIIYRIRSGEWGMWLWRSHCKTCKRNLWALELIPILSWLFQGWKCKWCKEKISPIYPLLEISLWVLFALVSYFLIDFNLILTLSWAEWLKMFFFFSIMFLTIIYVFYDILYLEIPENILLWANILTFWALIWQWYGLEIIPYLPVWWASILEVWVCFSVIAILYYIMLAWLREIYDCLLVLLSIILIAWYMSFFEKSYTESALLSWTVAALGIYISFFLQIILSQWRAMWAGDLRIGILMWLLVWVSFALPAWMICYLSWSVIGMIIILRSKIKHGIKSPFNTQIPFGPFIALWYLWVLFFSPVISQLMERYF